jgi:argininosuccinate lyase
VNRERKHVIAYIRQRIADVEAAEKKGRITAAERATLVRRLKAFADEIEQGMHL